MRSKSTLTFGALIFSLLLWAKPVFQPMVKEYRQQEGCISIKGLPIYYEDQRQCEIAAGEIPGAGKAVRNAGDISAQGIYIFTENSETGKALVRKSGMKVPQKKQGYSILVQNGRIIIIGHDPVGALYGAVTLRQMIEKGQVGNAVVRDWPDILYRGCMSVGRGLMNYAAGEKDRLSACKAAVDELVRHKVNLVYDYYGMNEGDPPAAQEFAGQINQYAAERGIYFMIYVDSTVFHKYDKPDGMTLKKWRCVGSEKGKGRRELYYCWSDDQNNEEAVNKFIRYIETIHAGENGIFIIHPVDAAFITDPEEWSRRCSQCRARWKDDERWKANVHLLNLWDRMIRKHFPTALVGSTIVPYQIAHLGTPKEKRDSIFQQNVVDFWSKVSTHLDNKDFFFGSWIADKRLFPEYRQLVGNRRVRISDTFPQPKGIFSTYHRYAGTIHEENSENIFSAMGIRGYWESLLLVAEHCWDIHAPGSETYLGGTYYDAMTDHLKPEIIMKETLPRICYTYWGRKMAPFMTEVMSSGIMPDYIEDPAASIIYINKVRSDPNYDPAMQKEANLSAKYQPVRDSTELMKNQMLAAEKVVRTLGKARPFIRSLDKYKLKYYCYLAKRAPYWLASARAQYNIRRGNDLLRAGKMQDALTIFRQGKERLAKDIAFADQNRKSLGRPDIQARFKLKNHPEKLFLQLDAAAASASVTLQPRRIGRFIRIGIASGNAAKGIKMYLDRFANAKVTVFDNLNLAELDKYDVVFIPNNHFDKLTFFDAVSRYVTQGGGGVVLEGQLCGHVRFDRNTPFPNIVKTSPERIDCFKRDVIWNDGTRDKLMYVDFFALEPGTAGRVLVRDTAGRPVAVEGRAGAGKVIFNGSSSIEGYNNSFAVRQTELFGMNRKLARYAVEYFTGIKLKEKKP